MKLILLALSCVVCALIAIACTETASPTNTATPRTAAASPAPSASASVDEFAHAKEIYAKNCEGCHGPNAEGGIAKVNNKQIKVPSLKADHAIKHTDEQLTKMITSGEEEMPSFKDRSEERRVGKMVGFIRKE